MSRYLRSQRAGSYYFFTLVTAKRRPLLTEPSVRHALRNAIQAVRLEQPFRIHGWVLLPDHLHCLWELPPGDTDFARRWSIIKRKVSQSVHLPPTSNSRVARRESGFWQRRFWEHGIRDADDYRRHMDYLHWNPVKHGLVTRVADWPWSSFHRLVREGLYPTGWGDAGEQDGDFGE
ncbi:REP-associated tyrosine transposase [Pseudomonas sp. USHLN015]|uniref:REP-associated tyrosine transposase n=1 Tax=Pseudomonas sp. USHLN015 TaxID=3081296 RepID=UPI00301DB975